MTEIDVNSLFGLDNDEIDASSGEATFPSNIYLFELSDVKHVHLKDKPCPINYSVEGTHNIIFEWMICDEDSQYYGETFQEWKTVFPGMTQNVFDKLTGPEKKKYSDQRRFLSMTAKNIGAESLKLDALQERKGIKRYIEVVVTNKQDDDGNAVRGFVKIKSVTNPDDVV